MVCNGALPVCLSLFLSFQVNHLSKRHPDMKIEEVPELTLPIIKPNRDYFCQYCDKVKAKIFLLAGLLGLGGGFRPRMDAYQGFSAFRQKRLKGSLIVSQGLWRWLCGQKQELLSWILYQYLCWAAQPLAIPALRNVMPSPFFHRNYTNMVHL